MISKAFPLLVASSVLAFLLAPAADARQSSRIVRTGGVELRYSGHVSGRSYRPHYSRNTWGELYTSVSIRTRDGFEHSLKADPEYGFFVASYDPPVSPGAGYVVLQQLTGGYASDGNQEWWHDESYCVFVEVKTARVVTQETGGFCGGKFTGPTTWASYAGELDLAASSR